MARLSSALLASATFAAAVTAQQCVASQTACAADDNLLLRCDGGNWATSRCASDQYCMTMMPGMVHCMLRPEGAKPSSTPSPTSSSSKPTSSPTSQSKPTTNTSKDSGAAANKAAAVGLGVVAVALVALF